MFSVRVAETAASGDVAPIHMAVAGKARWRDWRMRRFYVPNTNLSGSCVQILRGGGRNCFSRGQGTVGGCVQSSHIYKNGRFTVRRPGRGRPQRGGLSMETSQY